MTCRMSPDLYCSLERLRFAPKYQRVFKKYNHLANCQLDKLMHRQLAAFAYLNVTGGVSVADYTQMLDKFARESPLPTEDVKIMGEFQFYVATLLLAAPEEYMFVEIGNMT